MRVHACACGYVEHGAAALTSCTARRMMPGSAGVPIMLCVLPEPVCRTSGGMPHPPNPHHPTPHPRPHALSHRAIRDEPHVTTVEEHRLDQGADLVVDLARAGARPKDIAEIEVRLPDIQRRPASVARHHRDLAAVHFFLQERADAHSGADSAGQCVDVV